MQVKRIVFVNRAPFGRLDLDFSGKRVISLTGMNGSGKTTILSYIVDAFYEFSRKGLQNEFSGIKEGKLYRISSSLYNMDGKDNSLVYILFDVDGQDVHYIDVLGVKDESLFCELLNHIWKDKDISEWPIKYNDIRSQLGHGSNFVKYITIGEDSARKTFSNNVITYFPSYRYEQPGYLNDVFRMELSYKLISDYNGFLINPIEVTSDLPEIANWMMDVVLDRHLYGESESKLLKDINYLFSNILFKKYHRNVRIGIGRRNMGGARIQIVDSQTGQMFYPTIFNMSAGETALLCLFGEIIRQTDRLGKSIDEVEGIVMVDEVDKHLHIILQNEVIPELIKMFPKLQFVISTHSAFINLGLSDNIKQDYIIYDLDNGGVESDANTNLVFREAYDAMINENEKYKDFYNELTNKVNSITRPVVYLEGRTDEKYFKKAFEVFGYTNDIDFQWIGHMDKYGNEEFTGNKSLDQGLQFIRGRNPKILHFFVFDCDTQKREADEGNIVVITIPKYDRITMNKGIENALELVEIELSDFYEERVQEKDYGNTVITRTLDKMKLCNYICGLDIDIQRKIFANMKIVIDRIIDRIDYKNGKDESL